MWLREFLSQLSGSGGGDRLCAGLQWHSAGGGQAGGDQWEGRAAGLVRHAWGWGQLPVKTQRKKEDPRKGDFFFHLTCLKKGTKVECSTTETESFSYLHCALNVFCYILSFSITLGTSKTTIVKRAEFQTHLKMVLVPLNYLECM